ncbi:MAG: exodeoxyribonuclease VII small subunit [Lachnospiraceae bacterium]|jgi:exodeoxyribonuclease VII small subunit|nr:exodeoxyribonuclease VII small subunit [Lachnospiraceae bacterium]MBR5066069.1 exodeoxyribonuclease VII small subunit [Lachnospiraceae bacterium]MBR5917108.1 exodeoxyribonuclease VII small subunit [Lachnospiraceae bacterium]MBR6383487.1 exodeoxyribonuclease VII small subunit [Lachnospiraceae bacterium]
MDAVTIDEKIKSVEEILKELEKDDIAIEDALDLYTKGKVAIEECKNKIDMIEKEVLKINPDGTTSSFDDADF